MLDKLLAQAIENQKSSGNHINWEIDQVAKTLSMDDIEKIANALNHKRMLRQVEHFRNGTFVGSEQGHINNLRVMVASNISALNMQNSR